MYRSVFRWLLYVLLFNGLAATVTYKAVAEEADQQEFSQARLDQLLAPIALYPDALLSHILIAATYPLEVVMADRWAKEHPDLSGDEAINAADDEDWDPSVKALVAFPEVLKRMSDNLDWTEELGEAFLADEKVVLDSVQNLRQHAYDEGTLNDAKHIRVVKEESQIIIEPSVREVIYVPYYDTRVVYGSWWWSSYPPVYWHDYYSYSRPVYWGPRVSLSWGFYFSDVRWSHRHIVVVNRSHFHRPGHYRDYSVAHHRHAQHWQHQVQHRRGATYHNRGVHERYSRPHQRTTMSTPTEFTARLKEPRSNRYTTENNRDKNQRQHQHSDNKSANKRESRDRDMTSRNEERSEKTNRKHSTDQSRVRDDDTSREQRLWKADNKPRLKSSNDKPATARQRDDRDEQQGNKKGNQQRNPHSEPRLTNKFSGGVAREHSTREATERSARENSAQRSPRQESLQRASHDSSRYDSKQSSSKQGSLKQSSSTQGSSKQSFSPSRSSRESTMRSSSRESHSRQSSSRQSHSRQPDSRQSHSQPSSERMRMSGGISRNRDGR